MILITSADDLVKYLNVRRTMALGGTFDTGATGSYSRGAVFAFEEAIKAVEGLIQHQKTEEKP